MEALDDLLENCTVCGKKLLWNNELIDKGKMSAICCDVKLDISVKAERDETKRKVIHIRS